MTDNKPVRVLFVCMGNICRSPTAEGVMRHLVREAHLDSQIHLDSAGTYAYHAGEPPDRRAQAEARKQGIELKDIRARAVEPKDFEQFDYLVAMDEENLADLRARCPRQFQDKLHRLCEFADGCGVRSVPDPYYGGADGFRHVFELIQAGAQGLLNHIQEKDLKHAERRAQ